MASFIYSPNIVNSYIRFVYCPKNELDTNDEKCVFQWLPFYLEKWNDGTEYAEIIPDITKNDICVIKYENNEWQFYCARKYMEIDLPHTEYLIKTDIYIGYILNNRINFIQSISDIGIVNLMSALESYSYCPILNICFQKQNILDETGKEKCIIDKFRPLIKFNDIIAISKEAGVICINSSHYLDLIMSHINKNTEKMETIYDIFSIERYREIIQPALENFRNAILEIQNINPLQGYSIIHQYYIKYDIDYFKTKMEIFLKEMMNFINTIKYADYDELLIFLHQFVERLRIHICHEIFTIYHRFLQFPSEKDIIFRKYKSHAYIGILKYLYQAYIKDRTIPFHNSNDISNIIFKESDDSFLIYTDTINLLLESIKNRSQLFAPVYEAYHTSITRDIKPKANIKYNYFTFKIFSVYLFVMEHLLNNDDFALRASSFATLESLTRPVPVN